MTVSSGWRQGLINIGGGRLKPAPREAREARSARVPRGLGLGRGAVAPPRHGGRGIAPENTRILECKSVHFDAFCIDHYAKLYSQLAPYFNRCIVLDSTLLLEWIQPTSWPIALHKYFCSAAAYQRNFGGYKIFRTRLTKYCRGRVPGGVDAPASEALKPAHSLIQFTDYAQLKKRLIMNRYFVSVYIHGDQKQRQRTCKRWHCSARHGLYPTQRVA